MFCPYCGIEAATTQDEIAHMESEHPDIVYRRLLDAGMRDEADAFLKRQKLDELL